ncbi:hypothetical protein F511_20670 [Dorcoceras hygrometricum]|uniref:Uncharacterized protein n=1 Tax=Dorcoceras hygrometricum TaxID=472368 RepID=A0A2Z7AYZ5_9LAMI|nr:hypothetical protein F511_20670 [Dorcoceras hygrometricum]
MLPIAQFIYVVTKSKLSKIMTTISLEVMVRPSAISIPRLAYYKGTSRITFLQKNAKFLPINIQVLRSCRSSLARSPSRRPKLPISSLVVARRLRKFSYIKVIYENTYFQISSG